MITIFTQFVQKQIWAVVLLKISQNDPEALIKAFSSLMASPQDPKDKLVILLPERFDITPLDIEYKMN